MVKLFVRVFGVIVKAVGLRTVGSTATCMSQALNGSILETLTAKKMLVPTACPLFMCPGPMYNMFGFAPLTGWVVIAKAENAIKSVKVGSSSLECFMLNIFFMTISRRGLLSHRI